MKIKMLTTKSGPIASENWYEGEIRTVCDDEGTYWIKNGIAALHEQSVIAPIETATVAPSQNAVVAPPEVSGKGSAKGSASKSTVVNPAASGGFVSPTTAAKWGATGVK